ncbi:TlpA family protein disulfide reductase [Dyadobacter frigoris]|uniref:TlpA family protein disulfide reductase n=1 Tax=Dyadobacter frigoris TaxID=2576211 RepID=A0A4U6D731_9BACT|nr:TlpA disulfide reductase family protein [Dyadobacter frigoris]TKT92047.1 TlpA family protein disulfide reductase [Dyadobacter frigoris]
MTSTPKKLLIFALSILAFVAIYFVVFAPKTDIPSIENVASAPEASSVYLSSLRDLKGNPVAMDENKLVFLNVWATWCGPCNMEMPGIPTLYNKYKNNKKVDFFIISDEDAETVNPFIARKGYELPFYQFAGPYPPALDGNAIPRTYIIYKGKILTQEIGASQWDTPEINSLIEKQLAEI